MSNNNLSIVQGEDRTIELEVIDEGGAVFDITNHLVTFTIKSSDAESQPLILKTSALPIEVTLVDPVNGRADIFIIPDDTTNINVVEPGDYFYDIWLTTPGGKEFAAVRVSEFKITPRITQL